MRLFVGQIPREWNEHDVQNLFSQFGELIEVNILRQPDTLVSKGCAFVSYTNDESALAAIEALHDKFSPSEGRKIQVRDSAAPRVATETGRLYCSNLSETTNGNELFDLFSTVGRVLSVSILMTPYNQPKCSCLVEMATKADAQAVIDKFHMKYRLPGAPFEMSVTWARSAGSKQKTTGAALPAAAPSSSTTGGIPSTTSTPVPFSGPIMSGPTGAYVTQQHAGQPTMFPPPAAMYAPAPAHYFAAGPHAPGPFFPLAYHYEPDQQVVEEEKSDEAFVAYSPLLTSPTHATAPHPQTQSVAPPPPAAHMEYPPAVPYVLIAVPWGAHPPHVPPQSPLVATSTKRFSRRRSSSSMISNPSPSRYREGPTGANLFVKGFPLDWDNKDLVQVFEPYGDILSATVFKDKITGKSRGFGFISYSNKEYAAIAIQATNGRAVSDEHRITVEIKLKELPATSSTLSMLDAVDASEEEEIKIKV